MFAEVEERNSTPHFHAHYQECGRIGHAIIAADLCGNSRQSEEESGPNWFSPSRTAPTAFCDVTT